MSFTRVDFPEPGNARDNGQQPKGNCHIDVFEIVAMSPEYREGFTVCGAALHRNSDLHAAR